MQAGGPDTRSQRGIAGNEKQEPAFMGDAAQRLREHATRLGHCVPQDNRGAFGQQPGCRNRIAHTLLIRHQDQRRQGRARIEGESRPC
jgi:hypothetical protein